MAETKKGREYIKRNHKSTKKINEEEEKQSHKSKKKTNEEEEKQHQNNKKKTDEEESPTPRRALRSFFSCKHHQEAEGSRKKCRRIGCSGSLCSLKDNPGIIQKPETTPPEACKKRVSMSGTNRTSSSRSLKPPLCEINGVGATSSSSHSSSSLVASSSSSSVGGSFRVMPLRRLSGCYECHTVVDPINGVSRVPSLRATVCPCPDCGEVFVKSESLELHQAVRHAVSELGPEDTSRNIVEIIFQSSWLKKQVPVCKIDRILKVHNTQKTISRFEDYRDSIKSKANKLAKKHPRCIADGNELLRFQCTTIKCSLGLNGTTNLCDLIPNCSVCSIIRDGFKTDAVGKIRTMATSGRAHDVAQISSDDERRAMLVCRVIAGRVKKNQDAVEECDSVAGPMGVYSNLDELFVFNPRAILPCFVVIYRGF